MKIRTSDDEVVEVDVEDMQCSGLVRLLQESMDQENKDEEVPFYNVSHAVFIRVLEFTRHYRLDPMLSLPKPLPTSQLPIQKWYVDYVSSLSKDLFEVLQASTYLDIEPLQELICAWIASTLKGKDCHEFKQIFGFDYHV